MAASHVATAASPASRFSPWTNVRGPPRSGGIVRDAGVGRWMRVGRAAGDGWWLAVGGPRRGGVVALSRGLRRCRGRRGSPARVRRIRSGDGWWSPVRRRGGRAGDRKSVVEGEGGDGGGRGGA